MYMNNTQTNVDKAVKSDAKNECKAQTGAYESYFVPLKSS